MVEERTRRLTAFAETTDLNRVEAGSVTGADGKAALGIITSSTSYQYVKEVFGDRASVLKLGMVNPLPVRKIKDFAASVERLVVVEELDPIIEDHCRKLGLDVSGKDLLPLEGEFSQNMLRRQERDFLDDVTLQEAEEALGVPVFPVERQILY